MSRQLGPGGRVVGMDLSAALIAEARAKSAAYGSQLPVAFMVGDATTLTTAGTVPPESAERIYMERALQHIPRGEFPKVMSEFYAALKPGGTLVSVEPNWELFTVRSKDVALTRTIHHFWTDRFNHGNIAMNLPVGMRQAGFSDVSQKIIPVEFNSFADGEIVYDFTRTINDFVSKGIIDDKAGAEWLNEQQTAGENFYCCLMMAVTSGRK
jgi:ubiquinone/menaquinone biosynthesis C-methylase UbiE